ncbi:ABC transporter permease [Actinomadura soli]|uniref:ABC transporter permease n=1 Tax=Actinomadura soli TaxID=2508997 RepID=A0A5C4J818_9ACTN|nr:ABC transporter permease [Actinomadura soli]TMQ95073.1 ABC transporter permease [Actinomadura soli]
MIRTAWRNALAHKARLAMTMLAVLLGTAFVSGTLVFTGTLSGAYTRSSEKSFTDLDVQLRSATNAGGHDTRRLLDELLLRRAAALPGAQRATGTVSGFAALADRHGKLVGQGWKTRGVGYSSPGHGRPAHGSGAPGNGASVDGGPGFSMVEGRGPVAAGEVALDVKTAERTGYRVGDSVRLSVSGPVLVGKVTGLFRTDDGNVAAGGTLTLFDTATAQRLFAAPGHYNQIDLTAAPGTTPERLKREAAKLVPHGVEAVTAAELTDEQADENTTSFRQLAQVLLGCAGIALFVGVFLIVNTFTMLIDRRTRELALLRAVGATRGQVVRAVLAEAGLVGLVAGAAGLACGVGVAAVVRAVLSAAGANLPDGPLVVGAAPVAAAPALGVGVTVLAAWAPARRAAKIPPVAALSAVHAPPGARSLAVRNTVGAVLAAIGAVLAAAASAIPGGRIALGLGAVLLMVGVLVLTPLLSRPVIAAAGPALRRFGTAGRLAGQNAVRDPRRTAATASALTIGLALVACLSVIGASANRTVKELAASNWRADYQITMANDGPLTAGTEAALRRLGEVTATSPRREVPAQVKGAEPTVVGFRASDIDRLLDMHFAEGSFAPGNTAVVDRKTADSNGWKLGDTIQVTWPDGFRSSLKLTGIYVNRLDGGVKTDISVMDPHLNRVTDNQIMVKTEGGPSERAEAALRRTLGDSPAIKVENKDEVVGGITGTVGLVLNVLYGMLVLAVVIAVLGVVNTLAMSVHERAREIGLLRAVGLDRAEVRRMIRLEAVAISLLGGVLGVLLGAFLGWALGELVASLGFDSWTLVLPWGRLVLVVGAAALVGVTAAVWPARRAARLDILAAIRTE